MGDSTRGALAIQKLKAELRRGSSIASNNIAATYRELGNFRRAFHWWKRTADPQDGDAWLEVGYCLHYGVGTRRNRTAAIRAYRCATSADSATTEFGEEEARYHLAVALLDRSPRDRREPERLLRQAAEGGDYPQATDLLRQLREETARSAYAVVVEHCLAGWAERRIASCTGRLMACGRPLTRQAGWSFRLASASAPG